MVTYLYTQSSPLLILPNFVYCFGVGCEIGIPSIHWQTYSQVIFKLNPQTSKRLSLWKISCYLKLNFCHATSLKGYMLKAISLVSSSFWFIDRLISLEIWEVFNDFLGIEDCYGKDEKYKTSSEPQVTTYGNWLVLTTIFFLSIFEGIHWL